VTPPDVKRERTVSLATASVFAALALLAALDLAADLREGTTVAHAAIEAGVVVLGCVGAAWMAARVRAMSREAHNLRAQARALAERLETSREEAERWRGEAGDLIAGLAQAIDRQLGAWGLTAAEKEIALLLLKGLSHKEIAAIRDVGETTVRQQARAIYRKAGLAGRHDLAAFFLEDLLGPRPAS
jgi:DNA-binding CsgD family transcriptional regulator